MQRSLERYQVNCSHVPEVLDMVPDLSGQSMVLTGGTDGIGRALALMLASQRCQIDTMCEITNESFEADR